MMPLPWSLHLLASPALTITVTEHVPRPWRERLLTWPWRPWQALRTVTHTEPNPAVLWIGNTVVGHPATLRKFLTARYGAQLRAEGRLN
jgi:hypothetical protein